MKASVCMSTFNRPQVLDKVLGSIFSQNIPFDYEVIVVDDGPCSDDTRLVCEKYPIKYIRIDRDPTWRNPSVARNVAYRSAKGEVVIAQSDDVMHIGDNCIEKLVGDLIPGHFIIANVFNTDNDGVQIPHNRDNPGYSPMMVYTGPTNKRPFFFLGSLFRKDLYAVGGNNESYITPGYDDNAFADALIYGLGLDPIFPSDIVGHHLHHVHHVKEKDFIPSEKQYYANYQKIIRGELTWFSQDAPWPIDDI